MERRLNVSRKRHRTDFHNLRVQRDLPALRRVESWPPLERAAASVTAGTSSPEDALGAVLSEPLPGAALPTSAFYIETMDLQAIELPEQLLRDGPLTASIEVTHFRPPGTAWGLYAVLIAYSRSAT